MWGKIKKRSKYFIFGFILLTVIVQSYRYYKKSISPTKIGFINYRGFQLARINKANSSSWIKIEELSFDNVDNASSYDVIFIFGRGLQMSPEQVEQLQKAGYRGTHLYVESTTNPAMDLTNLKGQNLDYITDYFKYGGTANYKNMLNYTRAKMDEKSYFVEQVQTPTEIPRDVFFHLDEKKTFTSYQSFKNYVDKSGIHKNNQPIIALLTSVPGPFNSNRDHVDALITKLSDKGYNVVPISAVLKRLDFLKLANPDLVIFMPHGRLTLGQSEEAVQWLKQKNIPLISPLSVFKNYDTWVKDPKGMSGGMLTMNVVLPELDGGINPYAINAQFLDKNGYEIFKAIPKRTNTFVNMVDKWLQLKKKPNNKKKVAIYYFKGPGLNAMVAANMEVVPSLYNTLKNLKKLGYKVENIPNSPNELWNIILKQGSILGPYAKGAFNEYLKKGNPALVSTQDYLQWVKQDLKPEIYQDVVKKYGEAPGEYLSVYKKDNTYIAVARIVFGNVVLLPQPLPGVGEDIFKLVHGAKTAPAHPYIASYLWTRNVFKADAIIHFGTHGSLEFTPGKQVALSGYDWTDALIGNTPHFYVYTISNVGEGIIAKRRSYATLLSYLTPPFIEGEAYNELRTLRQKLIAYTQASGVVKGQYAKSISQLAKKLKVYKDLSFDESKELNEEQIFKLTNHIEEIANEKVTGGLYTIGNSYNEAHLNSTITLMNIDPLAYSIASLDVLEGKTTDKQLKNKVYFNKKYREPAKKHIETIINNLNQAKEVLSKIVSSQLLAKAKTWETNHKRISDSDIIREFIGMGNKKKKATKHGHKAKTVDKKQIETVKNLVIRVLPFPKKKAFIERLESEKKFKEASGLLDPETFEKAKTIAKAIPKMREAIEVGQDKDIMALLKLMQKNELYQKTFDFLKDKGLANRVAVEKERIEKEILSSCQSQKKLKALSFLGKNFKQKIKYWETEQLKTLYATLSFYAKHKHLCTQIIDTVNLKIPIQQLELQLANIAKREKIIAESVLTIEKKLTSIHHLKTLLKQSSSLELAAMTNGLMGGYTSPSSGGDPITNSATIPTGRNLYSIDAEKTPSAEAWNVGVQLAKTLLETHKKQNGAYPKKVSFTLWSGDFISTEGTLIGEIFYLLGVEPVRDPFGRVVDIRLIPSEELKRPRIDVVVQTAGQFRDLAASRMFLINKAVTMTANAKEETTHKNYVSEGVQLAEKMMKDKGLSPKDAREFATIRVFGGINGNYGTNIMGMVESGDRWENEDEIADTYLHNMGAMYGEGKNWGAFQEGIFEAALQNTEVVIQARGSNTWGGLSLDHVYEFMGGLNLAVRKVTGKDPTAYFNDFRNPSNPKLQEFTEAIWVEARSTLLNPKYIKEYMQGGVSSAEKFAETFRNTYGWNVMKPKAIDNELWNQLHKIYIKDELQLDIHSFFKKENPYALQEMTAVMLETVRKGYWKATSEQIKEIANLHGQLVKEHKAGCSGFVCDNQQLKEFINNHIDQKIKKAYNDAITNVREVKQENNAENLVMEKEVLKEKKKTKLFNSNNNTFLLIGGGLTTLILLFFFIRKRKKQY